MRGDGDASRGDAQGERRRAPPQGAPGPPGAAVQQVGLFPVRRHPGASPKFKQPVELAGMSKFRTHVEYDRRNLMTYVQPRLPVDLNRGYEQFRDRDRFNPYPAPLEPISESLRLSNQLDEVAKADFVTWRGNLAKVLITPWNRQDSWHMEAALVADTVWLNVVEPAENLSKEANRGERMNRMCFWGFSFEQFCNGADDAAAPAPIDSMTSYCSVIKTQIGPHRILLGAEMDACIKPMGLNTEPGCPTDNYMELKTTRLMDTPMQVMRFERDKLIKWWAQSFPAGVLNILVGFRDDQGLVHKTQVLKTLALPKMVAGKPHAWDATVSLCFLEELLGWLKAELRRLSASGGGGCDGTGAARPQMFRMEYEPHRDRDHIRLVADPGIRMFVPPESFEHLTRGQGRPSGGGGEVAGSAESGGSKKRPFGELNTSEDNRGTPTETQRPPSPMSAFVPSFDGDDDARLLPSESLEAQGGGGQPPSKAARRHSDDVKASG